MSGHRIRITLGALLILVAVVGIGASIVALVVLPRIKARKARAECINNLRQLQSVSRSTSYSRSVTMHGTNVVVVEKRTVGIIGPAPVTNCFCPMAEGTNRTFANSYDLHYFTSPPTCRICPDDHVLPPSGVF